MNVWAKRNPYDVISFKRELEETKSRLSSESGMTNGGAMMLHALIPAKIDAVMNNVFGPNWKDIEEIYCAFFSVCSHMKININSRPDFNKAPREHPDDSESARMAGEVWLDIAMEIANDGLRLQ